MPITVTYDLKGSRFMWPNTQATWSRRYRATGVTPDTPGVMIQEVINALPALGEPAPAPWLGLLCTNREVERIIGTTAYGVVLFSFPRSTQFVPEPPDNDGDVLQLSVTAFTEEVEREVLNGVRITIEDSDGLVRGETVTISMARARVAASRKEKDYPKARIDRFTNTLNDALWNGYAQGTVRCESIAANSISGGNDFDVQYTFIVKPEGWDAVEVVGRDLSTGKPIANPVDGTQRKTFNPYTFEDFDDLFISFT